MPKTQTKENALRKLDDLFSKYIRLKNSVNGLVKCYTCSRVLPWKQMQNGHFFSRKNMATRWDEDNCRPQCAICNQFKHGNISVFKERLIKEKGHEWFECLERKAKKTVKFSQADIENMINHYQTVLSSFPEAT